MLNKFFYDSSAGWTKKTRGPDPNPPVLVCPPKDILILFLLKKFIVKNSKCCLTVLCSNFLCSQFYCIQKVIKHSKYRNCSLRCVGHYHDTVGLEARTMLLQASVYDVMCAIRSERPYMIQTLKQYTFVYDCLLEWMHAGDTLLTVEELSNQYRLLGSVNHQTCRTFVHDQLLLLRLMTSSDVVNVLRYVIRLLLIFNYFRISVYVIIFYQ